MPDMVVATPSPASIKPVLLALGILLLATLLSAHVSAFAMDPTPEQRARCDKAPTDRSRAFCLAGYSTAPLSFPTDVQEGADRYAPRMAIYKPAGQGPFPAIILLHTCADLFGNGQLPYWVRNSVSRGYVAFVLDSYAARGIQGDTGCQAGLPNNYPVRARDAFAALAYLAHLPFVDRTRVAAMGFSNGARVSFLLASRSVGNAFAEGVRFAAVVTMYGQCHSPTFKIDFVRPDIATPLLALMGADDIDGDPHTCVPLLEKARAAGAVVSWTIFPGTGHVWDQPNRVPARLMPFNDPPGSSVRFGYNAAATEQSRDLVFAFLAQTMK